jgi:hypothetical protein
MRTATRPRYEIHAALAPYDTHSDPAISRHHDLAEAGRAYLKLPSRHLYVILDTRPVFGSSHFDVTATAITIATELDADPR